MQTGSNCRGKSLLTGEAFFLLLSNYAEPKNPPALDWHCPPQHPSYPATPPPPPRHPELLLPSQTPRLLGSTDISVPAMSATSLGGEGLRSLISPWPELSDFLISCQLYLHTSLLPPALLHPLLTQSPSPLGWLTESKEGSLSHTAAPFPVPSCLGVSRTSPMSFPPRSTLYPCMTLGLSLSALLSSL